jgi:hypothetical protein
MDNDKDKLAAMRRYEHYCKVLISLASQINQIEDNNEIGLSLDDSKDKMYDLLRIMLENKPDWA